VVVGGIHPSALPQSTLADGMFDIAVIGEGEQTFLEIVDQYALDGGKLTSTSLREINGIAYKKGKDIAITKERPLIEDIDTIPFPARDLFDMKSYLRPSQVIRGITKRTASILSSRGCPFSCVYCASHVVHKRRWRPHSVGYVISEIMELISEYKVEALFFHDDVFIVDKKRVRAICERLIETGLAEKIIWACEGRANLVGEEDLELVRLMRRAGCTQIEYGLESGSERMLRFLKNGSVFVSQNQTAIDVAKKAGLRIFGTFMLGTVGETEKDLLETRDFVHRNLEKLDGFTAFITTPYPGTRLWTMYESTGRLKDVPFSKLDFERLSVTPDSLPVQKLWDVYNEINYLGTTKISMKDKMSWAARSFFQAPGHVIEEVIFYLSNTIKHWWKRVVHHEGCYS